MWIPILLAAALGLALPVPHAACAAVISGTVRTPSMDGTATRGSNAYSGQASSLPGSHETRKGAATDAVVYVSAVPAGTPAPADSTGPHTLAQKDQRFAPRVLPITVGTTVDFPNFDPIFHNVFSVSPVRRFDLGKYAQGKSRRVEFDREGLVNVFCDIHSSMAAWILVLPHHVFAQPAADGTFRLPDLPPGHYRLMVWHPDLPTRQRDVDLPAAGLSLELGW